MDESEAVGEGEDFDEGGEEEYAEDEDYTDEGDEDAGEDAEDDREPVAARSRRGR